jgi:hypothetical protein
MTRQKLSAHSLEALTTGINFAPDLESEMARMITMSSNKCSVVHCPTEIYSKGFCKKHYTQILRHGRLTPDTERGVLRPCTAKGCERETPRIYCRKHARQIREHGRLTPEREHLMGCEGCSVKGCKEPHRAKGLCERHYNQDQWQRRLEAKKNKAPRTKAKRR